MSGADAASGAPEWRGRQGDGRELAIERGGGGDVLFSYGDARPVSARPADASARLLALEHGGLTGSACCIGKVIPSISVMRGYEALHAAAVDSPDRRRRDHGARAASGKSTLALELLRRGWPLFADDVLTLIAAKGDVSAPIPGTPHMNVALRTARGRPTRRRSARRSAILARRALAGGRGAPPTRTRPVRMLCLLERGPEPRA